MSTATVAKLYDDQHAGHDRGLLCRIAGIGAWPLRPAAESILAVPRLVLPSSRS